MDNSASPNKVLNPLKMAHSSSSDPTTGKPSLLSKESMMDPPQDEENTGELFSLIHSRMNSLNRSSSSSSTDNSSTDILRAKLPYASWFLFLAFGWSLSIQTPRWNKNCLLMFGTRCAVPICSFLNIAYFLLQCFRPNLQNFSLIAFASLIGGILLFFSFLSLSSLASLSSILQIVFENDEYYEYRKRLQYLQTYIVVYFTIIFEIVALYSGINFILGDWVNFVRQRDEGTITVLGYVDIIDNLFFCILIAITGIDFLAIMVGYNIACTLHEVQMDILVSHWRRRTITPLLMQEGLPILTTWQSIQLNLVSGTLKDKTRSTYLPYLHPKAENTNQSDIGDVTPLSAIVAQYTNVLSSISYTVSCWEVPILLLLYAGSGYSLYFGYRSLFMGNSAGLPFMIIFPFVLMFLLSPLARLNSKWIKMSSSQLDFSVSRYTTEEQLILGQLKMKQPLQFCFFGIPITWGLVIILEHIFIILPVFVGFRVATQNQ